jgi:outer membrane protein
MKTSPLFFLALAPFVLTIPARAQSSSGGARNLPLPDRPVSLVEALNLAESRNGTIVKAKKDLEASAGVVIQTKAITIPKLLVKGSYQDQDRGSVDTFRLSNVPAPFAFAITPPNQAWNTSVQLVQSIYEGGRMASALRAARLIREQAVAQFQTVLNDTFLDVRTAYYDVLLAEKLIAVEEASVQLLTGELNDATQRFDAGTVPNFNVLRARVDLANERPKLIRARNNYRTAKNNLANLMGFHLPIEAGEEITLKLDGKLEAEPFDPDLALLLRQALQNRPELTALRKTEALRHEDVVTARAGTKPSLQVFGGYADRNSQFTPDISHDLEGWQAGAQLSWSLFDGFLTKGKVAQAVSLKEKAAADLEDQTRRVELEVRSAASDFVEAKEVLASQEKVVEEAEEALRLATARNQAGTGTQLDVLDAETSLTQARTTRIQSTRDYEVAVARLQRATAQNLAQKP